MVVALVGIHRLLNTLVAGGLVSQNILTVAAATSAGTMMRASIMVFSRGQPLAAVEDGDQPQPAVGRVAVEVPVQGEGGGHEAHAHVGDVVRGGERRRGAAGEVMHSRPRSCSCMPPDRPADVVVVPLPALG